MTNFELAFFFLLGDEGLNYVNDPDDSGGPTKFGVTKGALETYLGHSVSNDEVKYMTQTTAQFIYQTGYWNPLKLYDVKDASIAAAVLDTGVLYGIGTAALMAQKALINLGQSLDADSVVGEKTLTALNSVTAQQFIPELKDQILARIEAITEAVPKDRKFRDGWLNRAARLLTLVNQNKPGGIA